MSLTLPLTAARVLITEAGPQVSQTVHGLLDQGATVDIALRGGERPDARVSDLASRGLIRITQADSGGDHAAYDVVLRDASTSLLGEAADTARPGPTGQVTLVGGGPGSPGLMTIEGLDAIRTADVLICDRLAPLGLVSQAPPQARVIHAGKIPRGDFTPQEQINALLVEHGRAGRRVVRLKGGDPFVFGRGGEEWNACVQAGVRVRVVPGVTSSIAAPALAGVPVTHRHVSPGYVVVSGHVGPRDPHCDIDWRRLAGLDMTLVVLMGVAALSEISEVLREYGMDPATPAMSVADAGMPSQRSAHADLATIAQVARARGVSAPAVTVIGSVVDTLHTPEGATPDGPSRRRQ